MSGAADVGDVSVERGGSARQPERERMRVWGEFCLGSVVPCTVTYNSYFSEARSMVNPQAVVQEAGPSCD